jgi:hypothetical protein
MGRGRRPGGRDESRPYRKGDAQAPEGGGRAGGTMEINEQMGAVFPAADLMKVSQEIRL